MTELKLIRTFDRIEALKDSGRWSFRQPKKQRMPGGFLKTHWDYLLDEMVRFTINTFQVCVKKIINIFAFRNGSKRIFEKSESGNWRWHLN